MPASFILERFRKVILSYISPFFPPGSAPIHLLVLGLWLLVFICDTSAGQVTLAWNSNSEIELGGYNLYYGQSSRNYTASVDVGNYTTYSLDGLEGGKTYYFAVTAYDQSRINESDFSSEVQATIPVTSPAAAFSASPTSGAAPLNVAFTDTSAGSITTWSWKFGDGTTIVGNTITDRNPSHTYSAAGTYTVSLTVTGPGGSNTATKTNYITVSASPPAADFSASPTSGVAPLNVAFTDTSTGSITSRSWNFGDGTTSTLQNPSHTYSAAGTYTVSLTVTGPGGSNTATKTNYITVAASDSSTIYEDAEDGTISGWSIVDYQPRRARKRNSKTTLDEQPTISNVFDSDRGSRVIQLMGSGMLHGYELRNFDGTKWGNSSQFVLEWSMKYSEDFIIYIDVNTTKGQRYLYYTPVAQNLLGRRKNVHHGLGTAAMDGQWQTFVRDLQADLADAQPEVTILEVNGFLIRGSGSVDNIKLRTR